jgi:hypothetical protein
MIVFVQARQLVSSSSTPIVYHTAISPAHSTKTHCGRFVNKYVRIQDFIVERYGIRCEQCERRASQS